MPAKRIKKKTFFTKRRKERIVHEIKKDLNINTWNRYLFILEAILFVGAIEEYIEGWVTSLDMNFNLHVILIMLLIGTSFLFAVERLEPLVRRVFEYVVRFRSNKAFRFGIHATIMVFLFILYSLVYFNTLLI